MNAENNISFVLKCGSMFGVILAAAGLLLYHANEDIGIMIMTAGISIIVITPMMSMITAGASFSMDKEMRYVIVTMILIATIITGMFIVYIIR
ncbi:MAG: DUF1634 domain-containing protein [Methanomassiliicoccaceae archaeon]|nr:DUF1634 domain-containing protein [Methanomassiliicoccaceae archaeon]